MNKDLVYALSLYYIVQCQPLLNNCAETHMWGRRLAAMLALYTSKGVTPEVNLRECVTCMPLPSANKAETTLALKPRGDITRSPK